MRCNKNCPRCGGNECGKQTDYNGKRLGGGQCCGPSILKQGQVCETPIDQTPVERSANIINAPCMYGGKGVDIIEDWKDAGFFMVSNQNLKLPNMNILNGILNYNIFTTNYEYFSFCAFIYFSFLV